MLSAAEVWARERLSSTQCLTRGFPFMADCEKVECEGLDEHAHFRDFGFAMLTLFRVSTGDNWNGILKVCEAWVPNMILPIPG